MLSVFLGKESLFDLKTDEFNGVVVLSELPNEPMTEKACLYLQNTTLVQFLARLVLSPPMNIREVFLFAGANDDSDNPHLSTYGFSAKKYIRVSYYALLQCILEN
jgi:hypothetical protein